MHSCLKSWMKQKKKKKIQNHRQFKVIMKLIIKNNHRIHNNKTKNLKKQKKF